MTLSCRIESHLTHNRKLWEQSLRRSQEGPSPGKGVLTLPSLSLLRLTLRPPIPTPFSFSREILKEPALQIQSQESRPLIGLHPLQTQYANDLLRKSLLTTSQFMEKFSGCLGSDSFPRKRQGKHPWIGVPNHRGQLCAEDKAGSFYSMVKVTLSFEIYKLQQLKENVLLVCVLVSFPVAMIKKSPETSISRDKGSIPSQRSGSSLLRWGSQHPEPEAASCIPPAGKKQNETAVRVCVRTCVHACTLQSSSLSAQIQLKIPPRKQCHHDCSRENPS